MFTLGITGGMGSGKTTASKFFNDKGAIIFNADQESKKYIQSNIEIQKDIIDSFGRKVINNNTLDLKGDYLIPIHWGAFTLSTHSWIEPPEKVFANAEKLGQKIILPQIGQIISMEQTNYKINKWWREFN